MTDKGTSRKGDRRMKLRTMECVRDGVVVEQEMVNGDAFVEKAHDRRRVLVGQGDRRMKLRAMECVRDGVVVE